MLFTLPHAIHCWYVVLSDHGIDSCTGMVWHASAYAWGHGQQCYHVSSSICDRPLNHASMMETRGWTHRHALSSPFCRLSRYERGWAVASCPATVGSPSTLLTVPDLKLFSTWFIYFLLFFSCRLWILFRHDSTCSRPGVAALQWPMFSPRAPLLYIAAILWYV